MSRSDEVRLPAKPDRLLGIIGLSILALFALYMIMRVMLAVIVQQQPFIQTAVAIVVIICVIISIPYLILFAVWALARLVFHLPAVVLTPEGIMNHSTVYHVVIPWHEIDTCMRDVPQLAPRPLLSHAPPTNILVVVHDVQRLYAQQQPLTRALLWLFSAIRPVNINTDVTEASPEEVWNQLERYVHETLRDTRIKFVSLPRSPVTRA